MLKDRKEKIYMLFSELYKLWWTEYSVSLASSTIHNKTRDYNVHIKKRFENIMVTEITGQSLKNYVEILQKEGVTANVIFAIFKIIRCCLSYGVEYGHIPYNPARNLKLPYVGSDKTASETIFTHSEVKKLIEVARPKWLGDMILLAYKTGMRKGEIFGLQWDDIDFEKKCLKIRRSIRSYAPKIKEIANPKTKKSRRTILLDDETLEMFFRRNSKTNSEWVFSNQYGELMSSWYVTKYMIDATKKAGIAHRSFHKLRHTHATYAISNGVYINTIQERLGHAKASTTLDIYCKATTEMQQSIVDMMNMNKLM